MDEVYELRRQFIERVRGLMAPPGWELIDEANPEEEICLTLSDGTYKVSVLLDTDETIWRVSVDRRDRRLVSLIEAVHVCKEILPEEITSKMFDGDTEYMERDRGRWAMGDNGYLVWIAPDKRLGYSGITKRDELRYDEREYVFHVEFCLDEELFPGTLGTNS